MDTKVAVGVLAALIVVVGGGYWYVTSHTGTPAPAPEKYPSRSRLRQ